MIPIAVNKYGVRMHLPKPGAPIKEKLGYFLIKFFKGEKGMRLSKNTTAHYSSFEELRAALGKPPVSKQTSDKKKLKKQRENFCNRHICKACGEPMTYIGGNVMTCTNDKCRGIKYEREDHEGNKVVRYFTSYDLLDDLGGEIASNIFS